MKDMTQKGVDTLFELDLRSRKPIYEQICDKIKQLIAMGELTHGDRLPAVRALAKEIGINHNTIQKAFVQLEREGVITSIGGKGSFVNADATNSDLFKKQALDEIRGTIEKNLIYAITKKDVVDLAVSIFGASEGE